MNSFKTMALITVLGTIFALSYAFAAPEKSCNLCSVTDEEYDPENGLSEDTPIERLDFHRYRFHNEKRRYFKVGEVNSCNQSMRFFAVPNHERFGACDCDWYQCSRPLLFDKTTQKCYPAWSQGPCESGEWYTFGKGMLPTCQKHPCPEHSDSEGNSYFYFQNPQDSLCYKSGTQGYCKHEDERLAIYPNQPIPICRNSTVCYPLTVPAQQYCIQGSRLHQTPEANCTFQDEL